MIVPLMSTGRALTWYQKNPGKMAEHKRISHERLKRQVFDAYGSICVCCGEDDLHFLTIDHINGVVPPNHRRADGKRLSGTAFLYKLREEEYPDTCRVLCWNCNCARAYYGFCPHEPHTPEQRRYANGPIAPSRNRATEFHCANGHRWTQDTVFYRDSIKCCRLCHRAAQARYREKTT